MEPLVVGGPRSDLSRRYTVGHSSNLFQRSGHYGSGGSRDLVQLQAAGKRDGVEQRVALTRHNRLLIWLRQVKAGQGAGLLQADLGDAVLDHSHRDALVLELAAVLIAERLEASRQMLDDNAGWRGPARLPALWPTILHRDLEVCRVHHSTHLPMVRRNASARRSAGARTASAIVPLQSMAT